MSKLRSRPLHYFSNCVQQSLDPDVPTRNYNITTCYNLRGQIFLSDVGLHGSVNTPYMKKTKNLHIKALPYETVLSGMVQRTAFGLAGGSGASGRASWVW
jgi:hypothetical protein